MNDSERSRRALALFDEAVELSPEMLGPFINEHAAGDEKLASELRALVVAAHRADGILEVATPPAGINLRSALTTALADRYDIGREIGRGGMAAVFLAREKKHDRDVVIKALDPFVMQQLGTERFLREVRIAATLAHPHIVSLIDSGEAAGLLYYVMPWMEGQTLRDRLRRSRIGVGEGLKIIRDVAVALEFAHESDVVHRDVKPENVFLTPGHAYLLDFGIAKLLGDSAFNEITAPGFALGTRRYMAPEQAVAATGVDDRADIYAWGLLGIEVLTGESYPPGEVCNSAPAALAHVTGLPSDVQMLLLECVSPDANRRPASMSHIVARLAPVVLVPAPVTRTRRPLFWFGGAAVAGAAAIAFAIFNAASANDGQMTEPIAVTVLLNETGDSTLSVVGRFAGDWVTDGLQRMGSVRVVPWSEARTASDHAMSTGEPLVASVRDEVGAGTVVTGTYYKLRDSLHLQAQLSNARSGRSLSTLPSIVFPISNPEQGIAELRDRVMGAVAAARDERVGSSPGVAQSPPSFSAYRAFDLGFDRFLAQDYDEALAAFRQSHARDTTFAAALLLGARAAWNTDEFAVAETLVTQARASGSTLGTYQDASLRYLEALLRGDGVKARAAILRAADMAPNSRAGFDHAAALLNAGYARDARTQLMRMDPDRGEMRGWSPYWTQRAHAENLLDNHNAELLAAREMAKRYPDRRVALVLEARALAAAGDTRRLDSALKVWESRPADVYWSQGAAMVVAADELVKRGRASLGHQYAERAVPWFSNRLVSSPTNRAHRYWLGSALYALGRYPEARPYFEGLATEFPDRVRYRGLAAVTAARRGDTAAAVKWLGQSAPRDYGEQLFYQARLAAIAGDVERAIVTFTAAVDHGIEAFPWAPAMGYHDLQIITRDARGRALLTGR
ncbi:MAG: protein kinase [Phycisphaerae bacterium]|nr:protein kinase [Gemmatimonadaceae bacterium]